MKHVSNIYMVGLLVGLAVLASFNIALATEITGTLSTNPAQTAVNQSPTEGVNAEFIGAIILAALILLELAFLAFVPKKQKVLVQTHQVN